MSLQREMAARIRSIYSVHYRQAYAHIRGKSIEWGDRHMARWDGGDGEAATYKPIWPRIAELCIEEELDPEAYVEAQFAQITAHIPEPNMLLSRSALERFRDYDQKSAEKLKQAWLLQENTFLAEVRELMAFEGLDAQEAARRIMRNSTVQLSSLYRYCKSIKANDPSLAEPWHERALEQYAFRRRAYDKAWGEKIPSRLRNEAAKFFRKLAGDA